MTNTELMNKVMTEDELDIVAGGGVAIQSARPKHGYEKGSC